MCFLDKSIHIKYSFPNVYVHMVNYMYAIHTFQYNVIHIHVHLHVVNVHVCKLYMYVYDIVLNIHVHVHMYNLQLQPKPTTPGHFQYLNILFRQKFK